MNDKAIWLSLVLYNNRIVKAATHPDEESAIEYLYEYMALNMIYAAVDDGDSMGQTLYKASRRTNYTFEWLKVEGLNAEF